MIRSTSGGRCYRPDLLRINMELIRKCYFFVVTMKSKCVLQLTVNRSISIINSRCSLNCHSSLFSSNFGAMNIRTVPRAAVAISFFMFIVYVNGVWLICLNLETRNQNRNLIEGNNRYIPRIDIPAWQEVHATRQLHIRLLPERFECVARIFAIRLDGNR